MHNIKTVKFMATAMVIIMTLGAAAPVMADSHKGERVRLVGTVTVIDLQGENFSITDRNQNITKVFVNPTTEFEIEKGKDFFGDDDIPFSDLRVGDWVKIKSYRINNELEASEVDVYRTR